MDSDTGDLAEVLKRLDAQMEVTAEAGHTNTLVLSATRTYAGPSYMECPLSTLMTDAKRRFPSCGEVRLQATNGSAKPRRKACSTRRENGQSGVWGNPNKRAVIFKRISPHIACATYETFTHLIRG